MIYIQLLRVDPDPDTNLVINSDRSNLIDGLLLDNLSNNPCIKLNT